MTLETDGGKEMRLASGASKEKGLFVLLRIRAKCGTRFIWEVKASHHT